MTIVMVLMLIAIACLIYVLYALGGKNENDSAVR
jgi:hypothetical protein